MRDPTSEELNNLKTEFAGLWPDAARAIKQPSHSQHIHATCQWMGFKTGYILAKEEAEG